MLRISEQLALCLTCANALAFWWASNDSSAAAQLKLPLLAGFGAFFLLVLVLVGQVSPLARARRPKLSPLDESEGLSASDFKTILAFAPRHQKVAALFGLVAVVAAFATFGSISWSLSSMNSSVVW